MSLPDAASEFIPAMRGIVSDCAKRVSRARACVRSVLTSAVCSPTVVEAYLRTGDDPQIGPDFHVMIASAQFLVSDRRSGL